jgi:hypothetical protein
MIHFGQHIDRIGIEYQVRAVYYTQGIELVTQDTLAKDKLSCIRTIETVHAVRPAYPVLQGYPLAVWFA